MKITNKYGLDDSLYAAVCRDVYVKEGEISTTQAILPPRIRQLTIRHDSEIEVDASDQIWLLLGGAVHAILERALDEQEYRQWHGLREERLEIKVNGWRLTGKPDLWVDSGLRDYKVTSVWSVIGEEKDEWVKQMNVNAYIYDTNGFPVRDMKIVAILRDWSKGIAKQGGNYPDCAVKVLPVTLWHPNVQLIYIEERVLLHQESETLSDDELPPCSGLERWEKPDTWAVMKRDKKRAVRVFDNELSAKDYRRIRNDNKLYIEKRIGESVRCESYCLARPFCNQYAESIGGK